MISTIILDTMSIIIGNECHSQVQPIAQTYCTFKVISYIGILALIVSYSSGFDYWMQQVFEKWIK